MFSLTNNLGFVTYLPDVEDISLVPLHLRIKTMVTGRLESLVDLFLAPLVRASISVSVVPNTTFGNEVVAQGKYCRYNCL